MKNMKYNFLMIMMIFNIAVMSLILSACHKQTPIIPSNDCYISGQVVEFVGAVKKVVSGVTVKYKTYNMVTNNKGKFNLKITVDVSIKTVSFSKDGYESLTKVLPSSWHGENIGLGQVILTKITPVWDFNTVKLHGWFDFSMPWFYYEKYDAILDDIVIHGANSIVINVYRSWGLEYHDGGCPDGPSGDGWWEHIVNDGWVNKQFCPVGQNSFEAPFMNIHHSREVNQRWLDRIDTLIQKAEDRGLWVAICLWCPYDYKWYGHSWNYWGDCSISPFVDGSVYHTEWQTIATTALLQKIKHHKNLIITDNWEEGGYFGSVNFRWKKMIFNIVESIIPDVPYFVYVGDDLTDRIETIEWINSEQKISGLHSHYNLTRNHEYYGLLQDKILLATEEIGLSLGDVVRALQWSNITSNRMFIMYVGDYRNYKNPPETGLPDDKVENRNNWYQQIDTYLLD